MARRFREEQLKNETLHAFGDSFTYGYDLSDCPTNSIMTNIAPSKLTYSALFAEHYGNNYECHAIGFSANNGILRQIKKADIDSHDMCFIMWSFPTRYAFMLKKEDGYYTLDYDNHKWWWDNVEQHTDQCLDRSVDSILAAQAILDKIGCNYTFLFNNIELQDEIQYNKHIHEHRCLFLSKQHKMINHDNMTHPGDDVHKDVFNILKDRM